MEIKLKIKHINKNTMQVETIGEKTLYSVDKDKNPNGWLKNNISTCFFKFYKTGNAIGRNHQSIQLYSNNKDGQSVSFDNFEKIISHYTARRCIVPTWINCYDEYMIPNIEHPKYEQWNKDCIVYSLFDSQNRCNSSRSTESNIFNHFFFMSNTQMKDLATHYNYRELFQDSNQFNEDRFVYTTLLNTTLSPDALIVLNMAKDLIRTSFPLREEYNNAYPEQQLQCWDAGWAQLKPLFKEHFKDQYKEFIVKYKELESRMRPLVYELGFLRND